MDKSNLLAEIRKNIYNILGLFCESIEGGTYL